MKDIVRHFESFAQAKGYVYTYGTPNHLNLKVGENHYSTDEDIIDDRYFMLAEPTTRVFNISTGGNERFSGTTYRGVFMIVKNSRFSDPYFAEQNTDPALYEEEIAKSKYVTHIEPLLKQVPELINHLICNELTIVSWEVVDWIDYLNENRDGIMVRYVIRQDV